MQESTRTIWFEVSQVELTRPHQRSGISKVLRDVDAIRSQKDVRRFQKNLQYNHQIWFKYMPLWRTFQVNRLTSIGCVWVWSLGNRRLKIPNYNTRVHLFSFLFFFCLRQVESHVVQQESGSKISHALWYPFSTNRKRVPKTDSIQESLNLGAGLQTSPQFWTEPL